MADTYYRIIYYIEQSIPEYVYSDNDFRLSSNGTTPIVVNIDIWNVSGVPQPTREQLDSYTQEQVDSVSPVASVLDVGSGNFQLTPRHLDADVIRGTPTGYRTWTLPSAQYMIKYMRLKKGSVVKTTFNNDSATKIVEIVLGAGMTANVKDMKIYGRDVVDKNSMYFSTIIFRVDEDAEGSEAVSLYKA